MIPAYSADPARRTQELMFTSESLRMMLDEWERAWMLTSLTICRPTAPMAA